MATLTHTERQRAVKQTLASWAIEGFEPDAQYLALLDRYVDGELTLAQVRAQTDTAFKVGDAVTVPAPGQSLDVTAVRLKREQIQLVVDGDVVGTGVAARKGLLQRHLLEKSD